MAARYHVVVEEKQLRVSLFGSMMRYQIVKMTRLLIIAVLSLGFLLVSCEKSQVTTVYHLDGTLR